MLSITVQFSDCSERRRLQREERVQVRPRRRLRRGGLGPPEESVRLFLLLHRFTSFET